MFLVDCPAEDVWVCGKTWTPDLCDGHQYANIPYDCPYMCGKCKAPAGIINVGLITCTEN